MSKHTVVICMENTGFEASLELRKLYEILPDSDAAKHGQVRVVDESGEDYLYPKSSFASVTLPQETIQQIFHAA